MCFHIKQLTPELKSSSSGHTLRLMVFEKSWLFRRTKKLAGAFSFELYNNSTCKFLEPLALPDCLNKFPHCRSFLERAKPEGLETLGNSGYYSKFDAAVYQSHHCTGAEHSSQGLGLCCYNHSESSIAGLLSMWNPGWDSRRMSLAVFTDIIFVRLLYDNWQCPSRSKVWSGFFRPHQNTWLELQLVKSGLEANFTNSNEILKSQE